MRTNEVVVGRCICGLAVLALRLNDPTAGSVVIECGPLRTEDFTPAVMQERLRALAVSAAGCESLHKALESIPRIAGSRLESLISLLSWFQAAAPDNPEINYSATLEREHRAVRDARRFVDEHLANDQISVPVVAQHVGLSPDYFSKLFQRAAGMNFTDYVNRERVRRVRRMLADETKSIAETALACGFGSVPHFNRIFRRFVGVSPTAYRHHLEAMATQEATALPMVSIR